MRRKDDFAKYTQLHVKQMDDAKTGKTYGAGVALATAKNKQRGNSPLLSVTRKVHQNTFNGVHITRTIALFSGTQLQEIKFAA